MRTGVARVGSSQSSSLFSESRRYHPLQHLRQEREIGDWLVILENLFIQRELLDQRRDQCRLHAGGDVTEGKRHIDDTGGHRQQITHVVRPSWLVSAWDPADCDRSSLDQGAAPDDFQHFKFSDGDKLPEDGGHPPFHRLCDAGFWLDHREKNILVHSRPKPSPSPGD